MPIEIGPQFVRRYPEDILPARPQESGLKPLKAVHRLGYNPNQAVRGSVRVSYEQSWVEPGKLFMPVSAAERREFLAGEWPAAEEPTAAEIAAFG